jgi:hypothetical protein
MSDLLALSIRLINLRGLETVILAQGRELGALLLLKLLQLLSLVLLCKGASGPHAYYPFSKVISSR